MPLIMAASLQLFLIRHGQTEKNLNGKLHGYKDEERLNAHGIDQIKKTVAKLKELGVNKIYCSTDERARESAEIIAQVVDLKAEKIDGLEERNWGIYTGKPWPEVKAVLDPMTLEERFTYIPPKGESWEKFEGRLIKALKTIIKNSTGKTVAIVTHGGAIRALMPYLLGVPREESFKYDPDNASITAFNFDGNKFSSQLINDTSHLNG